MLCQLIRLSHCERKLAHRADSEDVWLRKPPAASPAQETRFLSLGASPVTGPNRRRGGGWPLKPLCSSQEGPPAQDSLAWLCGEARKVPKLRAERPSFTPWPRWKEGKTGDPLVDANMRELGATGFMSNRGRQNVAAGPKEISSPRSRSRSRSDEANKPCSQASFLIFDLSVDWRYGAAHFEEYLLDYDPCSNWGNWVARRHAWGLELLKMCRCPRWQPPVSQVSESISSTPRSSFQTMLLILKGCSDVEADQGSRPRITEPRIPSASMSTTGWVAIAKPFCGQVPILRLCLALPVGVHKLAGVGVFVSSASTTG